MDCAAAFPLSPSLPHQGWRQPQQLATLRLPLSLRNRSSCLRAASAGVAVPLPGLSAQQVHTAQTTRLATASLPSAGNNTSSVDLLKRTLSGKLAGTSDVVTQVHSPQELQDELRKNDGQLVVLMCKALTCRPCKMFARKYQRLAAEHSGRGAVFLEIMGDDTVETRKLMISMQIKVTPTFCLYRGMDVVRTVTGINEDNLRGAVKEELSAQQGERLEQPLAP